MTSVNMRISILALETSLTAVLLVLIGLNAVVKVALHVEMNRAQVRANSPSHTHMLRVEGLENKNVLLQTNVWSHYPLYNSTQQWALLFPQGGVVRLGTDNKPHTVSMMHQLRCLDVLRDQMTLPQVERSSEPTHHCMNYLRQAVLFRGDLQLDPYQYEYKVHALPSHATRRCKDWRALYNKVNELQGTHAIRASGAGPTKPR